MRPHNCGHWTIDGAATSQFEQHLRAVLDLPLGSPTLTAASAVMVNVLGGDDPDLYSRLVHVMAADPGVKVHLYGKQVRPGRKVGHVTVAGDDVAGAARPGLAGGELPEPRHGGARSRSEPVTPGEGASGERASPSSAW